MPDDLLTLMKQVEERIELRKLIAERLKNSEDHALFRRVVLAITRDPADDGPEVSILSGEAVNG